VEPSLVDYDRKLAIHRRFKIEWVNKNLEAVVRWTKGKWSGYVSEAKSDKGTNGRDGI
jgi:hypothetical protein